VTKVVGQHSSSVFRSLNETNKQTNVIRSPPGAEGEFWFPICFMSGWPKNWGILCEGREGRIFNGSMSEGRGARLYSAGPSVLTKSFGVPSVTGNYRWGSLSEHRVCYAT
jgi:hypothetical protein